MLPNIPGQLQNYIDSNRSIASGSNSSEVSRNNPNLPDGWTIQMAEDGKTWHYYNEFTGKTTNQYPTSSPAPSIATASVSAMAAISAPAFIVDHDIEIIRDQNSINRDSFATDQSNEEETINNFKSEPAPAKTSKEVQKKNPFILYNQEMTYTIIFI